MAKKNTPKKNVGRFGGLIGQLHRETLVMVRLNQMQDFCTECARRGIGTRFGSVVGDSIIIVKD